MSRLTALPDSASISWNPREVLQIANPAARCQQDTCVGNIQSPPYRRCLFTYKQEDREVVRIRLERLPMFTTDREVLIEELEALARICLCKRYHQYQAPQVVSRWLRYIDEATTAMATASTEPPHHAEAVAPERHRRSNRIISHDIQTWSRNGQNSLPAPRTPQRGPNTIAIIGTPSTADTVTSSIFSTDESSSAQNTPSTPEHISRSPTRPVPLSPLTDDEDNDPVPESPSRDRSTRRREPTEPFVFRAGPTRVGDASIFVQGHNIRFDYRARADTSRRPERSRRRENGRDLTPAQVVVEESSADSIAAAAGRTDADAGANAEATANTAALSEDAAQAVSDVQQGTSTGYIVPSVEAQLAVQEATVTNSSEQSSERVHPVHRLSNFMLLAGTLVTSGVAAYTLYAASPSIQRFMRNRRGLRWKEGWRMLTRGQ